VGLFVGEIDAAIRELVADGCDNDEAMRALEERFGAHRLLFYAKVKERELDEQASREEWCLAPDRSGA
jgi:hypothetical protein